MEKTLMVNFSENEFRTMLKETVLEIMKEIRQTTSTLPEILDVKQAAELLRLKVTTLYEKTCRKIIPHFKKGNKLYFHRSELEAWVKVGKVKSGTDLESEAASYVLNKRRK